MSETLRRLYLIWEEQDRLRIAYRAMDRKITVEQAVAEMTALVLARPWS